MARDGDLPNGIEPQHPLEKVLDLIARDDKDSGSPSDVVRASSGNQPEGGSALAVSGPARPDQPWRTGQSQDARSLSEILRSTLRYRWTLALVFVVISAPLIAVIWTQIVPQYKARAEVRIRPIIPRLVFRTEDNGQIPFYESFVNTQVSMIRSLTVLQCVLDRPEVQQTDWYGSSPKTLMQKLSGTSPPPIERLKDGLRVIPRPRTEIIDLAFVDVSAKEAKVVLDAVLNEYLKYTGEATNAEDESLYRKLVDEYRSLESEIQGREKVCAQLSKTLETQTPEELISTKRVHLDGMQIRLGELRNTIAILEWEIAQTAKSDSNDVSTVADAGLQRQPEYYTDAEWRQLNLEVNRIQHQIDTSIQKPNHPDSLRLAKDLEFAEQMREDRETQLDEQWQNQQLDATGVTVIPGLGGLAYQDPTVSLEYQLARARQEERLVQAAYDAERQEFDALFESAELLDRETNALQHKRELFDAVRQRLDQKNIERNVQGSISVLTWAAASAQPDTDQRAGFTAGVLVIALGVAASVAYLRASRDKTICGFEDMPQPVQTPFLGHVPLIRTTKPLGRSLCDEIEQNQFLLVESIRVLRTGLLSRLDGADHESGTTVLITSAGEGTGKSSFTMMLGKSIAQAGRKVLMIDADFHKMTLSKRCELVDKTGLLETLNDKTQSDLPIFPTKTPGLDIMPAGRRNGDREVFEEIANGAFKSCISRIRERYGYDIVLLDTSPVLPVADATILARQVDGTIMVEREHVSQRTHVQDALARLGSTGGRLLGTVFVGSFNRERYGYGYSYGYGHRGKTRKS